MVSLLSQVQKSAKPISAATKLMPTYRIREKSYRIRLNSYRIWSGSCRWGYETDTYVLDMGQADIWIWVVRG